MSLRDAIHSEILQEKYECIICYETIDRRTPIWSCRECYRCFDLKCAKQWWKRETDDKRGTNCPFCRSPVSKSTVQRASYRCWCGKEASPSKRKAEGTSTSLSGAIPPHSCGQTCGAKRECPHPCPSVCHAGPHLDTAECTYMGPQIKCFCGKHSERAMCFQTRYDGFSCHERCGARNPVCGHRCTKPCHKKAKNSQQNTKNSCGACNVSVKLSCFCGKSKARSTTCELVPVEQRRRVKTTRNKAIVSCGKICDAELSCGLHRCNSPCHQQSSSPSAHQCPQLPYEGETCHCGRNMAHRTLCTDPVPSCGETCGRRLSCGHLCESNCHSGDCPPCAKVLPSVRCRCGSTFMETTCGQAAISLPICDRKCGAVLACGRHHCMNVCCEYSPKRLRETQNPRSVSRLDSIITEHNGSPQQVNRRNVSDQNPGGFYDGSGQIPLAARDYDLALFISKSEAAHSCSKVCGRQLSCGTHSCQESCHSGRCQPCMATSFEEWVCPCGRTRLEPPIRCGTKVPDCKYPCHRPQPCGHSATHECHDDTKGCPSCSKMVLKPCRCGKMSVRVRCDQMVALCKEECGNTLDCGHRCHRTCCRGGSECPPCTNTCDKTLKCGHKDTFRCHFPRDCGDCKSILMAKCPCGALRLYYECGEHVEISCNSECLREAYPPALLEAFAQERGWICGLELQIRQFVKQSDKRSLWLQPMSVRHRRLAHLLMEHYGISSESMDYGKNRSVCGHKTNDTWLCRRWLKDAPRKSPDLKSLYIDLGSICLREREDRIATTESDQRAREDSDGENRNTPVSEDSSILPSPSSELDDGMKAVQGRNKAAHSKELENIKSQSGLRDKKPSFSLLNDDCLV